MHHSASRAANWTLLAEFRVYSMHLNRLDRALGWLCASATAVDLGLSCFCHDATSLPIASTRLLKHQK